MFSYEICEIFKNTFLQNTFGGCFFPCLSISKRPENLMFLGGIKGNSGLKWVNETNGKTECHYYKILTKLFQNQTKSFICKHKTWQILKWYQLSLNVNWRQSAYKQLQICFS